MKKIIVVTALMLAIASCQKEQIEQIKNENMALTMTQGYIMGDNVAGQSDNILIFDGVTGKLQIIWGYPYLGIQFTNYYTPINGVVEINMLDITKMAYVYDNDTFDYTRSVVYDTQNKYHINWLSINASDDSEDDHIIFGVYVLDASLQYGDNTEMNDYVDKILTENSVLMPSWQKEGVFYPKSVSQLRDGGEIQRTVVTNSLSSEVIDVCEGVYVKWLNKKSAYSYWLFEGTHKEKQTIKSIGTYETHPTNRATAKGNLKQLGKTEFVSKIVTTKVKHDYLEELSTLFSSSEIYIYTGDLTNHSWLNVEVKGNTKKNTKELYSKQSAEFVLPEKFTTTK